MTDTKNIGGHTWVIEVQEDSETKELFLQLPLEAIDQVGWAENDVIEWMENDDGTWTLRKVESEESEQHADN